MFHSFFNAFLQFGLRGFKAFGRFINALAHGGDGFLEILHGHFGGSGGCFRGGFGDGLCGSSCCFGPGSAHNVDSPAGYRTAAQAPTRRAVTARYRSAARRL